MCSSRWSPAAFLWGSPQHILVLGIVLNKVQVFAHPLAELPLFPVSTFLQTVQIPLDTSMMLCPISSTSPFCVICTFTVCTLHPIIQIMNYHTEQYCWLQGSPPVTSLHIDFIPLPPFGPGHLAGFQPISLCGHPPHKTIFCVQTLWEAVSKALQKFTAFPTFSRLITSSLKSVTLIEHDFSFVNSCWLWGKKRWRKISNNQHLIVYQKYNIIIRWNWDLNGQIHSRQNEFMEVIFLRLHLLWWFFTINWELTIKTAM